jgi:hypothetical protein
LKQHDVPGKTTVIETIFTLKLDHQSLLEIVRGLPHDLAVTALEDGLSGDLDVALTGVGSKRGLRTEVDELSSEVSLVLRSVL